VTTVFSHLLPFVIARLGLLLVSGNKRDAEILSPIRPEASMRSSSESPSVSGP
jgi:hypothetical protein